MGMALWTDHYFLDGRGGDWEISPKKWCTAKAENKVVQMEMAKNIEQVLLLSLVGFFMLKKFLLELLPTK